MAATYETRVAVSSDGTRLSVRDHGRRAAPTIVLIHGYCCSQLVFSRQADSALAGKYRLVVDNFAQWQASNGHVRNIDLQYSKQVILNTDSSGGTTVAKSR